MPLRGRGRQADTPIDCLYPQLKKDYEQMKAALEVAQNELTQEKTAHQVTQENSRREAQWFEEKWAMQRTGRLGEIQEYEKVKAALEVAKYKLETEKIAHQVTQEKADNVWGFVEAERALPHTATSGCWTRGMAECP